MGTTYIVRLVILKSASTIFSTGVSLGLEVVIHAKNKLVFESRYRLMLQHGISL